MLIVDAHEDIAWNMLTYGRDYTRPVAETRQIETGTDIPDQNGDTLLGWPEYQHGRVAVVFGTLFAAPLRRRVHENETQVYLDTLQANRLYRAQLDAYHRLVEEHPRHFRLPTTLPELEAVLEHWKDASQDYPQPAAGEQDEREPRRDEEPAPWKGHPVGIVPLMEGAEGVRAPAELEEWWARGLRLIGPAWAGTRFCGGTREPGGLTREGFALLEAMDSFGFGLDLSHMDEAAALQALDVYPGPIVATHANAKALLKGTDSNRHLTDRVIRGLIERDAVIGVVPYNNFLVAGWKKGDRREAASLKLVVAQIDYLCQVAGDATHVGLGSDFDGGFGLQSTPPEIDSVADLQKVVPLLVEMGYDQESIAAILGQNWLARLRQILPEKL